MKQSSNTHLIGIIATQQIFALVSFITTRTKLFIKFPIFTVITKLSIGTKIYRSEIFIPRTLFCRPKYVIQNFINLVTHPLQLICIRQIFQ